MKKAEAFLPLGVNSAADTVRHALAPGWFECSPSSSGCRRQKLSHSACGSVCATTGFFYKSTDILLKEKIPERANEFQDYEEGRP